FRSTPQREVGLPEVFFPDDARNFSGNGNCRQKSVAGNMVSNLRILLVEDSEDIRFIMKTELEWMGYTVDVASDAPAALTMASAAPPDVIISDIRMPEMDGFEFIRRIRANPD